MAEESKNVIRLGDVIVESNTEPLEKVEATIDRLLSKHSSYLSFNLNKKLFTAGVG